MTVSTPTLLPLREVVKATSLSKATIYRGVRAGSFPAPVHVTERRVAWPSERINNFIAGLRA